MSLTNYNCSNLQYLPSGNINSNTTFIHRDETQFEDNNKIFIDSGFEKNVYLKYNYPINQIEKLLSQKHIEPEINSAFDKAILESQRTVSYNEKKYKIGEKKREIINDIVKERNQKLKEKEMIEKKILEETLTRIIKDSLKFTKENSPIIAMMPNKISSAINEIKEKKKNNSSKNLNNVSLGNSFNLSMISNNSTTQYKYESNAFLKALGLDLQNLTPNSIKIDIDEAYNFIKKWKISRKDINEIIRMKVVNEIMNVEERRSVQKLKKLNQKYDKYVEYKKKKDLANRQITEKSLDDYDNNTSIKVINTQNLVEEIKQINKEDIKISNSHINSNNDEDRRLRNEFSSINAKSTYHTLNKKEQNSNLIESNNLISTNYSQSNNNLNNFSNSNNGYSVFQTTKKNTKDEEKNFEQVTNNINNINSAVIVNQNTKIKKHSSSPSKRKLDFRLKPKPEIPPKKKRKLVLNSYKNVDRIMKIINNSENLKSNENLCKHFRNIRYNKKIDDLTNKLLSLNKLTIQDYEEVDLDV